MGQRIISPGTQQIFADPGGRRRTILLPLAVGAGTLLCGFAIVVVMGFLGGPGVPFSPVPQGHPRGTSRDGAPGHQALTPARPAASPSPSPTPAATALTGQPQGTSSPSAAAGTGTSTATANRAGKTPPGRIRTAQPSPHRSHP